MKIQYFWFVLCVVGSAIPAFGQSPHSMRKVDIRSLRSEPLSRTYPGIHLQKGEWKAWAARHDQTPRAKISPNRSLPKGDFSLLSYLSYVPSERDQWNCGNCYAWAGTGCLEMELSYRFNIRDRLSVQFFNSCSELGCACNGGWIIDIVDFYKSTSYAIPWSNTNAQWQDQDGNCGGNVDCNAIDKSEHYHIKSCEATTLDTSSLTNPEIVAAIKTVLNQGKALAFGFFMAHGDNWSNFIQYWTQENESTYFDISEFEGLEFDASGAGHEVVCVGYTDNAWIMLNSWGTVPGLRPNGLFAVGPIDGMNYKAQVYDNGAPIDMFYWDMVDAEFSPHLPLSSIPVALALLIAGAACCLRSGKKLQETLVVRLSSRVARR